MFMGNFDDDLMLLSPVSELVDYYRVPSRTEIK